MKKVISILLAFVVLCGVAFGIGWGVTGTYDVTKWLSGGKTEKQDSPAPTTPNYKGGMEVSEGQDNGVTLMTARIAGDSYEEYGISPLAESAYTITATVSDFVKDKSVSFMMYWADTNVAWSGDKKVTDYVDLTLVEGYSDRATVVCKQPFADRVNIMVTLNADPTISGTCTVDYRQRYNGVQFSIGGTVVTANVTSSLNHSIYVDNHQEIFTVTPFREDSSAQYEYHVDTSLYTIPADFTAPCYFTLEPTLALKNLLGAANANLNTEIDGIFDNENVPSYTFDFTGKDNFEASLDDYFGSVWGNAIMAGTSTDEKTKTLLTVLNTDSGNYSNTVYASDNGDGTYSYYYNADYPLYGDLYTLGEKGVFTTAKGEQIMPINFYGGVSDNGDGSITVVFRGENMTLIPVTNIFCKEHSLSYKDMCRGYSEFRLYELNVYTANGGERLASINVDFNVDEALMKYATVTVSPNEIIF